jgi:methylated-DNA-[protein]-cysteine S-methyltransferase
VEILTDSRVMNTPVGVLIIKATDGYITEILFTDEKHTKIQEQVKHEENVIVLEDCCNQLEKYFSKELQVFDIQYKLSGTIFQQKVWNSISTIPYGEIKYYSDISKEINSPKSFRAVGSALNKNKIPIVLPCHRIIGKNNNLTGFAGGLWRKEFLLNLEQNNR